MYIIDFTKRLFRKNNIGIIIYLILNIILYIWLFGGFSDLNMAGFALMLYLFTLCVALSPVGEWIMRLQTGCKKIKNQDDLNRLMPLFNEIYAQARAKDPSISSKVNLFMSNDNSANAFATGRKSICLTKGFMTFSDAQIKGTLAHEFAHLAHKDTDLLLLISVGNLLISAIFIIYRIIATFIVTLFAEALRLGGLGAFLTQVFVHLILSAVMWIWTKIGMLLVMHSGRKNEYEADRFAYELGYGHELSTVLLSFDNEDSAEKRSLWKQLHSTHPASSLRIAKLNELAAGYMPKPKLINQQVPLPQVPPQVSSQAPSPVVPIPAKSAPVPLGAAAIIPSKAPIEKRFCANCGRGREDMSRFCIWCGAALG